VSRRLLAPVLAGLALVAPAGAAAGIHVKRVDANAYPEVQVTAVSSARSGRPPAVRENGRPVAGLTAENLGRAKSVVLAVDRSQSMRGKALKDATNAARAFVARKPDGDRIAVIAVGRRALPLTRFSSATIDADIALRTIDVDGAYGTALNDAVVLAAGAVKSEALAGRVLILLTDGQEVSSRASLEEAIAAARRVGMAVFPIAIESPKFRPAPLKELAASTGGTYYGAASTAALKGVYAAIASELSRTWRLRYSTAARRGEEIRIDVRQRGAGAATASLAIPGDARESDAGASVLPENVVRSRWSSVGIGLAVGALLLAAASLILGAERGSRLRRRIAAHTAYERGHDARRAPRERFATGVALLQATEAAFSHLKAWRSVHRMLERADVPLRTVEFLYVVAGSAFALGIVAAVAASPPPVIVVAMLAGGALPFGYLWFKAGRRLRAFEDQLPDLLMTIAASLKAGHSFKQGLQSVVDEGAEPAAKEFKRVLAETQLGRPIDQALAEMTERIGSKDLEFVITAVTVQSQVGGSLAGLFDMVAEAVRQRQQFARKIKSLTAMGRAAAYVLVGLPIVLAALLTFINSEYMSPLYHTSQGHLMLGATAGALVVGSLMLKKIVSFKG
jgi:tight adherence protein B